MKVLFAVNSESISDAIIKKYQKDYREILSYKNVYYFNAILKEIQRDKSYDRIVISEDLEPFSNNNYESIDKFIFERLDGISDEAHDSMGNEISIILICSDRHTKGSSFLVKLFGISVYNALLGNDRSMEEVCRLINKPRTKKEAKMYYKIDTDDVNYRAENENEVSELEIQNIISHFKKLGKNTEKYSSSFENIAAQYTDEQLKIIINCLPINVKAILEETSAKYQEIMSVGGIVRGIKSNTVATREDQKRTGLRIDIIENKKNQNKMTGPIVIPNSVKSKKSDTAKKIVSIPQKELNKKESNNNEETLGNNKSGIKKKVVKPIPQKITIPQKEVKNKLEKESINELDDIELPDFDLVEDSNKESKIDNNEIQETKVVKKGRGRPRKNPVDVTPKPKGKRGRPRKKPIEEPIVKEDDEELDLLLDNTSEELGLNSFETESLSEISNSNNELEEFDDLLESEDIDNVQESENIGISELDELEDINGLDEDDSVSEFTEESFDEFDDYDEYGEYQTKTEKNISKEDIDSLYEEDILSEETSELSEIEEATENDETDDLLLDFESEEDDNLLDTLEDNDDLLDDFEDEDVTDSLDGLDEEDDDFLTDSEEDIDDLLDDFEDDNDNMLLIDNDEDENEMFDDEESSDDIFNDDDESEDLISALDDSEIDNEAEDLNDVSIEDDDFSTQTDLDYEDEGLQSIESPIDYSMSNLNSLMTKDKKIVTFLGSPKNGVSFLVNNLADRFALAGINTAILDMTKNKNSYYIYTQNEEPLRKIAYTSIEKLQNGMAEGIRVKDNLTVYTALPNDEKDYSNAEPILSTLVQNHSLVLIDCDFDTNPSYFASAQEIYLIQSMDILTIQPLTAFLRDLKTQGVLEPEKVRVVINKELKVKGLTNKAIIGGMSFYNDPAMSFMTELFNKDIVKYCSIPFEEMAYSKYLEGLLNCKISVNGYSKNFMNKLGILSDMVYPLTSSRQTYQSNMSQNYGQNGFSNNMNSTLNKMKKKY